MRENPSFALTDLAEAKALIRSSPWATLVSTTDAGLVASHYPVLLDEPLLDDGVPSGESAGPDDFVLLSHVGRPDERLHDLGSGELLIVFQGNHGYISPGWYETPPAVPTWNFTAVHAWGVPQLLPESENLDVLDRLVDRFERELPDPFRMRRDAENAAYAERIVHGTVGFRMRVTRWVGKRKLSQNKPPEVVERIIGALREPGPYAHPGLADDMDAERGRT